VKSGNGTITVAIVSNYQKNNKIHLKASVRGVAYFNEDAYLLNGNYIYSIAKDTFPEGIVVFTLFDENETPIAERVFFNERKDYRIVVGASMDKQVYNKRDEVVLNVETKILDTISVVSNASVLISNKNRIGNGINETILSHFLLSTDVKGQIEVPSSCFDDRQNLDIDNLMLTQGWRNFKYNKPLSKLNYTLEKGLNISGVINVKNSKFENRNLDFMLTAFGDSSAVYTTKIKVPGSFNFDVDDMFGVTKDILIQPLGKSEKQIRDFSIGINTKTTLPVRLNEQDRFTAVDSLTNIIINKNLAQKQIENKYFLDLNGVTKLDEVILEGYKMSPKRQLMFEKYGAPNAVIDGKEIMEKRGKTESGLYSVLMLFGIESLLLDREILLISYGLKVRKANSASLILKEHQRLLKKKDF
jgi:hypothetical protein